VPLFATLAFNFVVGSLAALAAARELRASPRSVHQARAFRALAAHEVLVGIPIAAFVLVRFTDWALSYLVDGARVPSAVVLAIVVLHGAVALVGFATAARLLRDHRPQWVRAIAIGAVALVVLSGMVLHRRLGTVGSYAQYHGGFGLRPWRETPVLGATIALVTVWAVAAAHLLWSLARRL
jgi:hypothetical protein